jgi:hypothetical protein
MAGNIKEAGSGGLGLQVTKAARKAGLVEEDSDGDATRMASVTVYGFDDLLLVVDRDRVSMDARARLVKSALGDTKCIHLGTRASVKMGGDGYQVQLPGCTEAGFFEGDNATIVSCQGVLIIHDGSQGRLARDLKTLRED